MKKLVTMLVCLLTVAGLAASAQTKKENTSKVRYNSVIDLIRGEPGLFVGPDQGPGVMPEIYVRGIGTNSGNSTPLFIIDDVRTDSVMALNPDDVFSVEVLKDATSSSYGLEGANGVIIFVTKDYHRLQEELARQAKEARALKKAEAKAAKKNK